MAAAIESLIVVLLGLFGIGFFLHSLMVGAPSLLTVWVRWPWPGLTA